jgi:DNA end-binding protein Ku
MARAIWSGMLSFGLVPAEEAPAATNVVDLTEALQSSVEAARKNSGGKAPAEKPDRKKTGPRKTARRGSGRRPAA